MNGIVSVILDFLILGFLGITIFYAIRLSVYFKSFRDSRGEMRELVRDLALNVDKAESSIQGMRNAAEKGGRELQEAIDEAKFLADELRFMNEAGDGLADRLEKLAERNRELVVFMEDAGGVGYSAMPEEDNRSSKPAPEKRRAPVEDKWEDDFYEEYDEAMFSEEEDDYENADTEEDDGIFMIRDPEFEEAPAPIAGKHEAQGNPETRFSSKAEQELYEALQRGRQRVRNAGGVS